MSGAARYFKLAAIAVCLLPSAALLSVSASDVAYTGLGNERSLVFNNVRRLHVDGDTANVVNSQYAISNQGYGDTDTSADYYWVHDNEPTRPGLQNYHPKGVNHWYYSKDGTLLWRIEKSRFGTLRIDSVRRDRNMFPYERHLDSPDRDEIVNYSNYITNACALMLDTESAKIVSPCFEDGIGTIYFDAINAYTNYTSGKLFVQIATNTIDAASVMTADTPEESLEWINLTDLQVLKISKSNSGAYVSPKPSDSVVLNITSASDAEFYRVYKCLNYRGPVRFRICRDGVYYQNPTPLQLEQYGMLAVDNILVSYPPTKAEIEQYGEIDDTRTGAQVLGLVTAAKKKFPVYNETNASMQCSMRLYDNAGISNAYAQAGEAVPDGFGAIDYDLFLHYRWRYHDYKKPVGWPATALFSPVSTNGTLVHCETTDPISFTNGMGDVEFYYTANIRAPYYDYHDYTGLFSAKTGSQVGSDWTERISSASNRLASATATRAGGSDYFIRLREGESGYSGVQCLQYFYKTQKDYDEVGNEIMLTNIIRVVTNEMEIVNDHLWRCYIQTPKTNEVYNFGMVFRGYDYVEDSAVAIEHNSTGWCGDRIHVTESLFPFSRKAVEGVAWDALIVDVDSATGYLMMEFNDKSLTYAITHADYQNFNLWTDCINAFGGETGGVVGVSYSKKRYGDDFSGVSPSGPASTNRWWHEHFEVTQEQIRQNWPIGKVFNSALTPNGWIAEISSWAAKTYVTNGLAVQLEGRGRGSVAMQQFANPMNGLDSFEFIARLAQFHEFNEFAYFRGTRNMNPFFDSEKGIASWVAFNAQGNSAGMSPGAPSISMVANYFPGFGCYEMRITKSSATVYDMQIFKWSPSGTGMVPKQIGSTEYLVNDSTVKPNQLGTHWHRINHDFVSNVEQDDTLAQMPVMYFGASTNSDGNVVLSGGVSTNKIFVLGGGEADRNPISLASGGTLGYVQIIATDDTATQIPYGTYGIGTADCEGYFRAIYEYPFEKGALIYLDGASFSHGDNITNSWYMPLGRNVAVGRPTDLPVDQNNFYIKGLATPQKVEVFTSPSGFENNIQWTSVTNFTVASFTNSTFRYAPQTVESYHVKLQHAGAPTDARTDVTVLKLDLTSWRGRDTEDVRTQNKYNEWVYTETWQLKDSVAMVPRRANPYYPLSIRSPIMKGFSILSFDYSNAKKGVKLYVQVNTNAVEATYSADTTLINREDIWKTVNTISFAEDSPKGTITYYYNYHAPQNIGVRIIMDPDIVSAAAKNTSAGREAAAKQITITNIFAYDEPKLDKYSWTGWNYASSTNINLMYLSDYSLPEKGLSGTLNNSTNNNFSTTPKMNATYYSAHNPYIQTPAMSKGIGKISFKARKYDPTKMPGLVSIFGSKTDGTLPEGSWVNLTNIVVDSDTYQLYSWAVTGDSSDYKVVRLSIDGVVENFMDGQTNNSPQRVTFDEVVVSEPVAPSVAFAYVRPFRNNLGGTNYVEGILSEREQPLLGENFGFQAELVMQQLAEELDQDSIEVYVACYPEAEPWGWEKWRELPKAKVMKLLPSSSNLVYRSSFDDVHTVMDPQLEVSNRCRIVQYYAWANYKRKGSTSGESSEEPMVHELSFREWTAPDWIWPLDFNRNSQTFAAFTILEDISPRRVWFNEFNTYSAVKQQDSSGSGEESWASTGVADTNQFLEIAVPAGSSLSGWYIRAYDRADTEPAMFAVFGSGGVKSMKTAGVTNHYAFLTLNSPATARAKGDNADGVWTSDFPDDAVIRGKLSEYRPYALELVRPSGIVERQIGLQGMNWAREYAYGWQYDATNLIAEIIDELPADIAARSLWHYAGEDTNNYSVGVMSGAGLRSADWEDSLKLTPQEVNRRPDGTLQNIDPDYYIPPNGTNVWIFADVIGSHIRQMSGENTANSFVLIVPSGGSTSITYTAESWWRVGNITTNGVQVADAADKKVYTLELKDIKETMDVVASAQVASSVSNLIWTGEKNGYVDSIMNWLSTYGDETDIILSEYHNWNGDAPSSAKLADLTLTEMYWFDMCPTQKLWLVGDISKGPSPVYKYDSDSGAVVATNIRIGVKMMITNIVTGAAYPPSVLQTYGNTNSLSYRAQSGESFDNWDGVNMKIEASLKEGPKDWVPLRWFVFKPGSFDSSSYEAIIDVLDPFSVASPAHSSGWSAYSWRYTPEDVYFRFRINSERTVQDIDILKADSTYGP